MSETAAGERFNAGRFALLTGLAALLGIGLFAAGVMVGTGLDVVDLVRSGGVGSPLPDVPFLEAPASAGTEAEVDMTPFWEAWDLLEDRFYYDLPSEEERVYGAIQGMVDVLDDPYTSFVDPESARLMQEDSSGTFEGIGAYVEEAPEGGVYIIRVFDGGPADKAGIRAGDTIIAADGEDLTRMILRQALLHIRGPAGTPVTLTIVREGTATPLEVSVTRARLDIPTVETRMLDSNIGYVALFDFNARSSQRLQDAVRGLLDQGAEKLVLDLRDNPGGYLDECVSIADMFLPRGIVLIQRDVDGNTREYTTDSGDFAERIPLVVLVNENSASASEIVAAAIQDNGRGILIGETTFGKGLVQLQYSLSDGSMLRVTYANWYTPADKSISEQGVEPDIIVETPAEPTGTDVQLERAVEYLTTGK